jgi:TonB-linked SusC/RagA family outer membrane protein
VKPGSIMIPFFNLLKRLFLLITVCFITVGLYGQVRMVTGIVTGSEDNLPIPGVIVAVSGINKGTVTNVDGLYSLELPLGYDTIVFRLVGMTTQKLSVAGKDKLDIVMGPEVYEMKAVVVTALGITKEAKSLGYSVTAMGGDEIAKSNDRSVLNSLQGKIAGVNISSASGAPGSSTRVMMRGVSSLSGSNQPLIVINGVTVNNTQSGSSSINGGTDFGNKLNDLNPDDIESVSFLKGAAGTVQYGSRAANGVIIITTKSGSKNAKTQVSFNSSVTLEEPLRLINYQNEYGQGLYGNAVLYENTSWGPRFDNKYHPWGNKVDGEIRVKSYRALPDNVDEFFETGINYSNSLSINGGNDNTTYYLSYSNVKSDGIFPTDADSYLKHSLSLNSSHKISEKWKSSSSINYIKKKSSYVATGQGGQSVYNQVMQTPRDISLREVSDIDNKYNTVDNYYSLYTVNPYYILNKNSNKNEEDRVLFSVDLDYNVFKSFSALWRFGGDVSNEHRELRREKIDPQGNNEFSPLYDPGMESRSASQQSQLNSDLILTYKIEKEKWSLNLMAGQSLNQRSSRGLGTVVSNLTIPGYSNISNSVERPQSDESTMLRRNVGAYGSADFSYKSFLFFSFNARNEWSSTLPKQNNSYFYPGANIGFIFSELIPSAKKILPYGKLRLSWARVANDAPPYLISNSFQKGFHSDGYGYLSYPLNGVNSYDVGDLIANENLKPELTEEYEIGSDLKFFNNRISIDFTYYNKSTTNLIWSSPVAYSTGYALQMQNLGKLTNKGIETLLTIVPVQKQNFSWEFSVNYTKNDNKLNYLNNQLEEAELNAIRVDGGRQISWVATPGNPVGDFKVRVPKYTTDGKMVVDNKGLPLADDTLRVVGNSQYKYFGGVSNQFIYKNLTFSFRFDFRVGGKMYSQTKEVCYFAGTVPATVYNDREPFIIPNSVVETERDKDGNPMYAENTKPIDRINLPDYWGAGGSQLDEAALIDRSFIKLREVILSYNISKKYLSKIPVENINLSIIGKNLLLWTPKDQTYIDPELTTFGNDLMADFGEYGAQPSTRSITFNLRILF